MSARLRGIARETEEIVEAGGYRTPGGREVSIAEPVAAARAGTRVYGPEPVPVPQTAPAETFFEVTGESSLEAARRLGGGPAVLNFASARNPGGGFLNGAQAQEEALCRSSALYRCLLEVPGFYDHHRAHRDPFYSDRVIHSPAVPVFRDDRGRLLDEPYPAGFLTAAAPNAGVIRRTAPERAAELPRALAVRAERVLETAAAHGYRRLVLGAWGCGVFQNDPGGGGRRLPGAARTGRTVRGALRARGVRGARPQTGQRGTGGVRAGVPGGAAPAVVGRGSGPGRW